MNNQVPPGPNLARLSTKAGEKGGLDSAENRAGSQGRTLAETFPEGLPLANQRSRINNLEVA